VKFRQTQMNSASGIRVPSEAMRRGDFSELLTTPNAFYSSPQYIRDPLLTGNCNATDRGACFPNNVIPANRVSPQGLALLRSYPVLNINLPGANQQQVRGAFQNQREDTFRSTSFLRRRTISACGGRTINSRPPRRSAATPIVLHRPCSARMIPHR
jgi:hypothetical protein